MHEDTRTRQMRDQDDERDEDEQDDDLDDESGLHGVDDPQGELAPQEPYREPARSSGWPNFITATFITVGTLFALRYAGEFITNDALFIGLLVAVILLFLGVQYLRRCLVIGLISIVIFAVGAYVLKNWEQVKSGKVTVKDAGLGVIEVATGFGPGKDLKRLVERTGANEKVRKLTQKMEQTLVNRHPGLDLKAYLQRVDSRNPAVNTLAAQIVEPCDSKDRLCEATMLLSFVTDKVKYRTDPLSRPMEGDYPKPPTQTLEAMAGDCEDKSILLLSLLGTIGIPGYMVFEEGHAHALVCFETPIDEMMVERVRFRGWSALHYLEGVLGPLTEDNLKTRFEQMAPAYLIKNQYCYAAETTAAGSWFGVDENQEHLGVYDPFGVPASD